MNLYNSSEYHIPPLLVYAYKRKEKLITSREAPHANVYHQNTVFWHQIL